MERPYSSVPDFDSRCHFLHRSLGSDAGDPNAFQQNPHLASSCVCRRLRGTSLVPDALGNIFLGTLYSLGWKGWSLSRYLPLAVAGCTRCRSRRRIGFDPPAGVYLVYVVKALSLNIFFRPCPAYTSARRSHLPRSLVQSVSWLLVQLLRTALVPNQFFQMHPNGISAKGLKGVQWSTQLSGLLLYAN